MRCASTSASSSESPRHIFDAIANMLPSLNAPTEVVKQIIINIEAGVEVEVTIAA